LYLARVHAPARHVGLQVYWTCLADLTSLGRLPAARDCAWPWRTAP